MKNKLVDLRDHLFETIEQLKDRDNPMDINRAIAVAEVARQVIATAKVEADFLKKVGDGTGTGFFEPRADLPHAGQSRRITHRA